MATLMERDTMAVDPVTFEILSHRLYQLTKEVGSTLERVGGTVQTTQMHDYMCALYRANGDVLQGEGNHAPCAGFAVRHIIERFANDEGIHPGDMFLLNDPYVAAVHQSDIYIITPIHFENELVAWSATFVHVMDIGALSPGGDSPGATHVCQEGLRIPGIKFVDRGELRRDIFEALTNMTRQPGMVGLDLKCEIAGNSVARARMQEIYAHYGPELVDAVSSEMIRYSEAMLRKRIAEIPDGSWSAVGNIAAGGENLAIRVRLDKEDDHLRFDFTGTDPQTSVGINRPYHSTWASCSASVVRRLAWDIPKNQGAFAPIEVIVPPGTIMSAQYPAPVSIATTGSGPVARFVQDATIIQMVATSEKWRGEVMAAAEGGARAHHAGVNQYGHYYVSAFGGLRGGGARSWADGMDTGGTGGTTAHNIEWCERNYPMLYLFRRHTSDGPGAGMFRGGAGEEVAVILHDAPEKYLKIITYGVQGLKNSGCGVFGGYPAPPSQILHIKDSRIRELLAAYEIPSDLNFFGGFTTAQGYTEFDLGNDDVFYLRSLSGGGFGDPLDRDPNAVVSDLRDGIISPESARVVYGVVLADSEIDVPETEKMRKEMGSARIDGVKNAPTLRLENISGASIHPLRENLEVVVVPEGGFVRCVRCTYVLSRLEDDWMEAALRRLLPVDMAGPLFRPFANQLHLEQHYCPSCGVILNTELQLEESDV